MNIYWEKSMRNFGKVKLSVGFASLISGSCVYAVFNQHDSWNSVVKKYMVSQLEIPPIIPKGLNFLGYIVSQFPKQALDLSQSDYFFVRSLFQQILVSAHYPSDFDFEHVLQNGPASTLLSLARNPVANDKFFIVNSEVAPKGEEILNDAFRELLASLPSYGQSKCTRWFTESACRGGKSGHLLYQSISWAPGDVDHVDAVSPEEEIPLFLKALRKHSEVEVNRSVILDNGGLNLLKVVAQHFPEVKTARLIASIVGNLALDKESHDTIIEKGWIETLRQFVKSKDIVVKSHALRALANLDRQGERGSFYEDGIFVLHPVERLKWCKPEADVVFVHGLCGSPFKTWRSSDSISQEAQTDCWPKEWLPADVPSCRKILVKYDSELSDWTSKCPLEPEVSSIEYRGSELMRKLVNAGVGQRPVIWIAHSMGGLLVKQLLVDSLKAKEFCSLRNNTKGVIFYGVPHKGSDIASIVSGKARYVLRPSSEVKELQKGSEFLENLHKKFVQFIQESRIDVLSYGETEPFRMVRDTLVVPRESADFGLGEFIQLAANHYQVCKPRSRSDPCYFNTVLFVKECITNLRTEDNITVLF